MASSDSQIDKPQRGRPKRAELPDVNINTGAQSINTERAFLRKLRVLLISPRGLPECISLQSLLCRLASRTSDSSQKKKKKY